jgi:hypothetical protein
VAQAPLQLGELAAEVLDRGDERTRGAAALAHGGPLAQRVEHLLDAHGAAFEAEGKEGDGGWEAANAEEVKTVEAICMAHILPAEDGSMPP